MESLGDFDVLFWPSVSKQLEKGLGMESKQLEARIVCLEAKIAAMRSDRERLLDAVEDYYLRAHVSECYPMEGEAIVSLGPLDEWCHAYTNRHLVYSDDYLAYVGIRRSESDPHAYRSPMPLP